MIGVRDVDARPGGDVRRREFMAGSLAASAGVLTGDAGAQAPVGKPREFYELRRYAMQSGPQMELTEHFVANALIPALNRMGFTPVGAFHVEVGPETPTLYVLIPAGSVEALVKIAEPFWSAPARQPAFGRYESSLMSAFTGWPKLMVPASTAAKGKRIFQLRTYESPSDGAHVRKVEMFHHGEFEIFARAGFFQVFYGDVLIGERLPKLTYMLSFADMAELGAAWDRFRDDPGWKKLSSDPRYAYEAIVSNIDNLILSPASFSQI